MEYPLEKRMPEEQKLPEGVVDEPFVQERRTAWVTADGDPQIHRLPEAVASVERIAIDEEGGVYAQGLDGQNGPVFLAFDGREWGIASELSACLLPDGGPGKGGKRRIIFDPPAGVRLLDAAFASSGEVVVGTDAGLFVCPGEGAEFIQVFPADEKYAWIPRDVRAVAYDRLGRFLFGCPQGVGMYDGKQWTLYTGEEGLPFNGFTCAAAGEEGVIWFGTTRGAIRFDGTAWSYRASPRWMPDDHINGIAVTDGGTAWIATPKGISRIERISTTLKQKADHFLACTEERHNRDGFVVQCRLAKRGDLASWQPDISDNDGLYTACYGAAMAFKYAATRDPEAKALANRSFQACKRLVDIVPSYMKGFPARVVVPIDWHEPLNEILSQEGNIEHRKHDPFWKLLWPRFVTSEDGQSMWKCDTSSDELAGHFFFYGVYNDLVAETEEEKAAVRDVVGAITDHLVCNDFALVDYDGTPTRWARYGPDYLNSIHGWPERGLNSMQMLSYLKVAEHVTGDAKYAETARMLREKHNYHINAMVPRPYFPPELIAPWDNNLATLSFYGLIRYETDPELLILYRQSIEHMAMFINRLKNSFWNIAYLACAERFAELARAGHFAGAFPDAGPFTEQAVAGLTPAISVLPDVIDTLRGMPEELLGWRMTNSVRLDIIHDTTPGQDTSYGWSKATLKALPIEERGHVRQDRASDLDSSEGDGWSEHEGTLYLLPYYMALYHKFIG